MPRIVTTLIDDTDSRFTYEGTWTKHRNTHEYGQSSHLTHGTGTATLKFRGTSISVYGTLASSQESQDDPVPPVSLYTLENGRSAQFVAHAPTSESEYHSQFFRMDNLPYGDHVLVVKNTAEKDMFLLDYVEIGGPSRQMPITTLVGVVLGSVVGTLLLVFGLVLYWRRKVFRRKGTYSRKSVTDNAPGSAHDQDNLTVVPYNLDNPPPQVSVWSRLGQANPLSMLHSKTARARDIESAAGAVDGEGNFLDTTCAPRPIIISVCCDSCVAVGGTRDNNPPPYHSSSGSNEPPTTSRTA